MNQKGICKYTTSTTKLECELEFKKLKEGKIKQINQTFNDIRERIKENKK